MKLPPITLGQRFGKWTVLKEVKRPLGAKRQFLCVCACGTTKTVDSGNLSSGKTTGCMDCRRPPTLTHGKSQTREYKIWKGILGRCYNPHRAEYIRYGGRGIAVCERWRTSFENFLLDMGVRPSVRHSVDRFPDSNGNYEPSNCRWATREMQQENKQRAGCIYSFSDEEIRCEFLRRKL